MDIKTFNFERFFLLSDIHMGVRANSLEWLENQKLYFYEFFIPLLKSNMKDGDVLFILGDVFDNRQSIDTLVSDTIQDIIHDISKLLPVHILCGNHDMYKRVDNDVNSLRVLSYFENVHVYTKPTILSNNEVKILLLPYSEDYDVELETINKSKCDYLFAHADIMGMKLDNGMDVKKGLNLSKSNLKMVLSGHIHKRQLKNKVVYIGSPYQTKRSDMGDEKGVYLFNANANSLEFFPNTVSPIFIDVRLESIMNLTVEETKDIMRNNYVNIVIPKVYVNSFNISTFISAIDGCAYKRVESEVEKVISENNTISFDDVANLSVFDIIVKRIIENTECEEDREKLLELNEKYYKLANSVE